MTPEEQAGQQRTWHYMTNDRREGGHWYTVAPVDGGSPVMPALINEEGAQHWVDYLNTLERDAAFTQRAMEALRRSRSEVDHGTLDTMQDWANDRDALLHEYESKDGPPS